MSWRLRSVKALTRTLPSFSRARCGPAPAVVRSTSSAAVTSAGRRLPGGLNGLGSLKTGSSSTSSGTWQVAQPSVVKSSSPWFTAASATGELGSTRPGTGKVAWKIVAAVTSPSVSSSGLPSASGSASLPKRSTDCIPWWWFMALFVNSRSETTTPFWWKGRTTRSAFTPATALVSNVPSGLAVSAPKPTPLVASARLIGKPAVWAWASASARIACRSRVISRAKSSMKPAPNMPSVLRSLATWSRKWSSKPSPASPSKFTNGKRWPSTNTLATLSPPPPRRGTLWQPAHELASGAEIRLKFSGKPRSGRATPVPVVSGRPAPSSSLKFAAKSASPAAISSSTATCPASTAAWSTWAVTTGWSPTARRPVPPPDPSLQAARRDSERKNEERVVVVCLMTEPVPVRAGR